MSIAEIPKFLRDDTFREQLVENKGVRFFIREFWEEDYGSMSPSRRQTETASLATRLNRFVRSPIVGNIIGQSSTTIDFRKAIEHKEIILIRLPIKTLPEDAAFIGTMLTAQIHAAIFSFGDLPLEQRPGFSLFVDEFQHFATVDFAEMFTEGRKFGSRVTVAHQFREQIPDFLASATLTARSILTFQTTQTDAGKMAPLFLQQATTIKKEDIDPDPTKHLLAFGHSNPTVEKFIKTYVRPLQFMTKAKEIEVSTWEQSLGQAVYHAWQTPKPTVKNPIMYLTPLLYEVETKEEWKLPIPLEVIEGFANCGVGYYNVWEKLSSESRRSLARVVTPDRIQALFSTFSGPPEQKRQLSDFLITLRAVMQILATHPIGERKPQTLGEVAQHIVKLPRRHALVKIGTDIAEMQTLDTPQGVAGGNLAQRKTAIREQTRKRYCRPAAVVEEEMYQRRKGTKQESQKTQGQQGQGATPPETEEEYKPGARKRFVEDDV